MPCIVHIGGRPCDRLREAVGKGCGNHATTFDRITTRFRLCDASRRGEVTTAMIDQDLKAQVAGYSLTTAEILYRLPDHPSLLQSFVWQEYDIHPRFPRLKSFLDFWSRNLEGKLYRITVAHRRLITPAEVRLIDGDYRLN